MVNYFPTLKATIPFLLIIYGSHGVISTVNISIFYYSTWNPILTLGDSCMNIGSNYGKTKRLLAQVQTGGQQQWVGVLVS